MSARRIRIDSINSLQLFNLIRFTATLGIGIFLAKSGLPTAEISIYETLLFLGNLLSFFWVGGGQNALLSFFPKLEKEQQARLLVQAFGIFLGLGLLSAGVLYSFQGFILRRLTNFSELPYFSLLCWYLVFVLPSFLLHFYYLLLGKYREIIWFGAIGYLLQMLLVLVPIYLGWGLEFAFRGLVVWAVIRFIWTLVILIKYGSWTLDLVISKRYLLLAIPLILHLLIGNSVEYIDGLIVSSYFTDDKAFAVFRYGARELPISVILVGALVASLIPKVAVNLTDGLEAIKRQSWRLARWLYPLSGVLMLVSPFLFPWVYNADFEESARVFNVYLLILSSRILLPQIIIISQEKSYFLVWSAIFETVINVGLSLLLVQFYGLVGIAFASVLAYMVDKVNLIAYNYWSLGIPPARYIPVWRILALNIFLFACFGVSLYVG